MITYLIDMIYNNTRLASLTSSITGCRIMFLTRVFIDQTYTFRVSAWLYTHLQVAHLWPAGMGPPGGWNT
jgi:hypothetical protein